MWKVAIEICRLVEQEQTQTHGLLVHENRLFYDGISVRNCELSNEFEVYAPAGRFEYVSSPEAAARAAYELAKQDRR